MPRPLHHVAFLTLSGLCLAHGGDLRADSPITEERAAELEHMVIQDCGSCHGLTLRGGLGSPLTRDAIGSLPREGLSYIILDGVPGTAMPPWRPLLSENEALWIADYLLNRKEDK